MALAATLQDAFNGASVDTGLWTINPGSSSTVGVVGGRLRITPLAANDYASLVSAAGYILTGSEYAVALPVAANVGNGTTETMVRVYDGGFSNYFRLYVAGSPQNLIFHTHVGGTDNYYTLATYNPAAHLHWRLRESGGTLYVETSPDRATWTTQRSQATPFALTTTYLNLVAGYYGTEPSPGYAEYDNLNTVPIATLAATGAAQATGSASRLAQTQPLAAVGAGTAAGSAALTGAGGGGAALAAIGAASAGGTAAGLALPRALAAVGAGLATGSAAWSAGVIMQVVRGPYGDIVTITNAQLATYQAQGYTAIVPPYIVNPDDNGAWDTGPFSIIGHADGRRYATTYLNFVNYYQPLGFTILRQE